MRRGWRPHAAPLTPAHTSCPQQLGSACSLFRIGSPVLQVRRTLSANRANGRAALHMYRPSAGAAAAAAHTGRKAGEANVGNLGKQDMENKWKTFTVHRQGRIVQAPCTKQTGHSLPGGAAHAQRRRGPQTGTAQQQQQPRGDSISSGAGAPISSPAGTPDCSA